ncbi:MAG: PorV/PorQ family protein [candidate division KSB1 bacterium]|nr:PorV/PorQ family protein [candidate division KSB1 bacterium]
MKKLWIYTLSGLVLGGFWALPGQAQRNQKLAQTGFQFLSVVSDARAAAMGNAVNSLSLASSSLFFNPAGLSDMTGFIDITASDNRWIADIHHNTVSLALRPWHGRYGVLGFTAQSVDYGDNIFGTIIVPESQNPKGYIDTEDISPSALALGLGYAIALSDRFSVGGQVRWVHQEFGDMVVPLKMDTTTNEVQSTKVRYESNPLAFDFGTLFKTGFKGLTFGMSVRNFSREVKYIRENFELPLVFTIGIHTDLMDWVQVGGPQQSMILSLDAKHDRSHAEQICLGVDYRLMRVLSCRIGYISSNDEDAMNYGLGVSLAGITVDYAYAPFGVFNNVQRLTVRFSY